MNDFAVQEVSFDNLPQLIEEGRGRLTPGGCLRVDLSGMKRCDSATICLLLDLLREGNRSGCQLKIQSAPAGLEKLASLYQLRNLLAVERPEADQAGE